MLISFKVSVNLKGGLDLNHKKDQFKIVGYYPNWEPDKTHLIQYEKLTHIIYAFGIPTADGQLRPLKNPEAA